MLINFNLQTSKSVLPYLAIAHQVSYSSYPLVLKNLFLKRHKKKRNTTVTALYTVTGLQQSIKGTQKLHYSFRGPVNMAEKNNKQTNKKQNIDMCDYPVHDCFHGSTKYMAVSVKKDR